MMTLLENIAGKSGLSRSAAIVPIIALLVWSLLVGCNSPPRELEVAIAGHPFRLELALDPKARSKGLMERDRIREDGGMLFAYRTPRPLSFAMPHCRTPIDLAFLDGSGRVLAIHTMAVEPPQAAGESYLAYDRRLPRYSSGVPAQFVIELRGGRFQRLGVEKGDLITLPVTQLARWAR
jgi:uncharacterized membrane protein (UPF0127 family)